MSDPYVRVEGRLVRLEGPPGPGRRYDVYDLIGAGCAGFMAGLFALAALVQHG